MTKRTYEVVERAETARQSHRSFLFPECIFTLRRLEDGQVFRVTRRKSQSWKAGDWVELEDSAIQAESA